jgi:hypothetical protein
MNPENTHTLTEHSSPEQWQEAVNNAYADLLIGVALESGFLNGPEIDLGDSWETLMHGLEQSVRPQKEKVIDILAEAIEPGASAKARRFAEKMWEECAGRVEIKGH